MFTKAESAQPYIYSIFTPAGNCCPRTILWERVDSREVCQRYPSAANVTTAHQSTAHQSDRATSEQQYDRATRIEKRTNKSKGGLPPHVTTKVTRRRRVTWNYKTRLVPPFGLTVLLHATRPELRKT
jgi:hypothetical protein